jgi:hypothetical protein
MRIPLTEQLLREAAQFQLRTACVHCFHYLPATGGRCAHEWPNQEQRRWPIDPSRETEMGFCKEFELR